MAELVIEGVAVGYAERPYDFEGQNGERLTGVSHKLKVRVAAPGTGTVQVKVPEECLDEVRALGSRERVRLTFDADPALRLRLSEVEGLGVEG